MASCNPLDGNVLVANILALSICSVFSERFQGLWPKEAFKRLQDLMKTLCWGH